MLNRTHTFGFLTAVISTLTFTPSCTNLNQFSKGRGAGGDSGGVLNGLFGGNQNNADTPPSNSVLLNTQLPNLRFSGAQCAAGNKPSGEIVLPSLSAFPLMRLEMAAGMKFQLKPESGTAISCTANANISASCEIKPTAAALSRTTITQGSVKAQLWIIAFPALGPSSLVKKSGEWGRLQNKTYVVENAANVMLEDLFSGGVPLLAPDSRKAPSDSRGNGQNAYRIPAATFTSIEVGAFDSLCNSVAENLLIEPKYSIDHPDYLRLSEGQTSPIFGFADSNAQARNIKNGETFPCTQTEAGKVTCSIKAPANISDYGNIELFSPATEQKSSNTVSLVHPRDGEKLILTRLPDANDAGVKGTVQASTGDREPSENAPGTDLVRGYAFIQEGSTLAVRVGQVGVTCPAAEESLGAQGPVPSDISLKIEPHLGGTDGNIVRITYQPSGGAPLEPALKYIDFFYSCGRNPGIARRFHLFTYAKLRVAEQNEGGYSGQQATAKVVGGVPYNFKYKPGGGTYGSSGNSYRARTVQDTPYLNLADTSTWGCVKEQCQFTLSNIKTSPWPFQIKFNDLFDNEAISNPFMACAPLERRGPENRSISYQTDYRVDQFITGGCSPAFNRIDANIQQSNQPVAATNPPVFSSFKTPALPAMANVPPRNGVVEIKDQLIDRTRGIATTVNLDSRLTCPDNTNGYFAWDFDGGNQWNSACIKTGGCIANANPKMDDPNSCSCPANGMLVTNDGVSSCQCSPGYFQSGSLGNYSCQPSEQVCDLPADYGVGLATAPWTNGGYDRTCNVKTCRDGYLSGRVLTQPLGDRFLHGLCHRPDCENNLCRIIECQQFELNRDGTPSTTCRRADPENFYSIPNPVKACHPDELIAINATQGTKQFIEYSLETHTGGMWSSCNPTQCRPMFTLDPVAGRCVPNEVICDPFDPKNLVDARYGLEGEIRYVNPGEPINVAGMQMGQYNRVNASLFLNQLNVPTREFTRGFALSNTSPLKKENGETLFEWFGLSLKSSLQLKPSDSEGWYQLAMISDDDSLLKIVHPETNETITFAEASPGPTKVACGREAIYLRKGQRLPISVSYVQGPRVHIALMLMWRKVDAKDSAPDALCGQTANDVSNDLLFDWRQDPSVPTDNFRGMQARGWKVPEHENYLMSGVNKCSTPNGPVVPIHCDIHGLSDIAPTACGEQPGTGYCVYSDGNIKNVGPVTGQHNQWKTICSAGGKTCSFMKGSCNCPGDTCGNKSKVE